MARGPFCEHGRGCKRTDLVAQFTMPLREVTKANLKTHPQPQYYCGKHTSEHPNVSPISGQPIEGR